jgi:hypothetical protein
VLFISPLTMVRIVGLLPEQSECLMQMLRQHATQPHLLMTHRWAEDDLVMWDNRGSMHLAPLGLPLRPGRRSMFRVTTRGQPLIGAVGPPRTKREDGEAAGATATRTAAVTPQPMVSRLVRGRPILACEEELSIGAWAGVAEGVEHLDTGDPNKPGPGIGWAERSASRSNQ